MPAPAHRSSGTPHRVLAAPTPPPAFAALSEALSGWPLPVAALAVLALAGLLHLTGLLSESATATVGVVTLGLAAALYLTRPALDRRHAQLTRALAILAALLTLLAVVLPALATVHPGRALAAGDLAAPDATLAVPEGLGGRVRLLVSGALGRGAEPAVRYTLGGTEPPVEGRLERTFSTARVGRSGRARVAHDRTSDMFSVRLAAGARELKLERLQGDLGGPLHVAVHREPLPIAGGPWALALFAVLLAALVDARLGRRSELAVAAGMAVAFGLLVTYNATPGNAVGPVIGGVVLGAIVGSLGGWILALLLRRFLHREKELPARGRAA